ncbi:hypothetical protein BH23ACT7_BH23ACT7_21760 [soil metagenome]
MAHRTVALGETCDDAAMEPAPAKPTRAPAAEEFSDADEGSADDRILIRSLLLLSPEERLAGLRRSADFFANARRV